VHYFQKCTLTHLVAIENQHQATQHGPQGLDALRLAGAGRAKGITAQSHVHRLREDEIAAVGEPRVDQLAGLAQKLVGVFKFGINHADANLSIGINSARRSAPFPQVISELTQPMPIACVHHIVFLELLYHTGVVYQVQKKGPNFEADQGSVLGFVFQSSQVVDFIL